MSERTRLFDAIARRREGALKNAVSDCDVLRLVDDEGDECPDIIVDRYGPVLRIELKARSWPSHIDNIARALAAEAGTDHVVGLLRKAGGKSDQRILFGDPPRAHVVNERGVRLLVKTAEEDAAGTGVFVDYREGRALVAARARGAV